VKGPTILRRLTDMHWSSARRCRRINHAWRRSSPGAARAGPLLEVELAAEIGAVTFKLGTGIDRRVAERAARRPYPFRCFRETRVAVVVRGGV